MKGIAVGVWMLAVGCGGSSPAEANGYNVELDFGGAPLGMSLPVGRPNTITVRRIEDQPRECDQSSCDSTTSTPITLVSASCDALCTVTPLQTEGEVALQALASAPGSTTLHVAVRAEATGETWADAYPLTFR